jgi:long-subunit acyl-CoA synthetase (AMP-forming)
MPAIQVFSGGIKFLKDHLFQNFQDRVPQLQDGDIHWVLTVPAIWDEVAKKFMRKSAEEVNTMFTVLKHMVPDFESNNMVSGVGLYSV